MHKCSANLKAKISMLEISPKKLMPRLKHRPLVKARLLLKQQNIHLILSEEEVTLKRVNKQLACEPCPLEPSKFSLPKRDSEHNIGNHSKQMLVSLLKSAPRLSITNPKTQFQLRICENIILLATESGETKKSDQQNMSRSLSMNGICKYTKFCDDFGPMSLGTIYEFVEILKRESSQCMNKTIILESKLERRALTNAVFLLGSYLIITFQFNPDEIVSLFHRANDMLISFRDVSPGVQNFHLHLRDCWAGLWKAKQLGWIKRSFQGFDASEYAHYANPFNADLHEIVPGKFIAMRGPKEMPAGQLWRDVTTGDGRFSHRELSPEYYVDILRQLDVQAVVRLNAPEYRKEAFTDAGLGFVDLYFEDCTCPPADVVAKFMMIAEGLPGALAVHCKSGLGRAGTLIALYMIQHYDFTAQEAMGWLRIVRPGSVIGPQQKYLVEREAVMRRTGARFLHQGPNLSMSAGDESEAVARLIADAGRIVDERLQAVRSPEPGRATSGKSCRSATRVEAKAPRRMSLESAIDQLHITATSIDSDQLNVATCIDVHLQAASPLTARGQLELCVRLPNGGEAARALRYCSDLLPLPLARHHSQSG